MAAAPTANTRAFLLVRAYVVDLDDLWSFFLYLFRSKRENIYFDRNERMMESRVGALFLSRSLSLSLSLAHPSSSSTKRERSNALFFYSLRTSIFPGREGENINRLIFS